MSSPILRIQRIVVTGELHLDLKLESGVNVIHATSSSGDLTSTNKAGKTGLVELIQYGLGRRQKTNSKFHFEPIQKQLDKLWLEVRLGDRVFTIERSLTSIFAMMRVREAEFVQNIEAVPFANYPVEDISKFFLKELGIPEASVKTQVGEPVELTFPNLMRAFILHQENSFSAILDKVEPEQRKADIIGFLTGITPIERFPLEEEVGRRQREVIEKAEYANSVKKYLIGREVPTLILAEAKVQEIKNILELTRNQQLEYQLSIKSEISKTSNSKSVIEDLYKQILGIKGEISRLEHSYVGVKEEEFRLAELAASLKSDKKKIERIQVSSTILSSIEFNTCPRCLLEITQEMKQREQKARCMLCNRPLRTFSDAKPFNLTNVEDIDLQLDEIEKLIVNIKKENSETEEQLIKLRTQEKELNIQLDKETIAYVSPHVDYLRAQSQEITKLEAQLIEAQLDYEQALDLRALENELFEMENVLEELEKGLNELKKALTSRLSKLNSIYENILHRVNYPDLRTVSINSNTLMPWINGSLYIHGGRAYKGLATTCYHLAMLQLAIEEETFFPRFLVIDSPAVGDLNQQSEEKLLNYIAALNESYAEKNVQIILTTRHIVPALQDLVKYQISRAEGKMLLR